ncbi:protein of CLR family [Musa troglodytarum]|uniref:Protein of CLR family n=1 Tax=Musa troglodytarum TaxID=320322 RepID=A0A9E7FFU7_9LILI|nr:protein of CLR family [Musa troglodytarum]
MAFTHSMLSLSQPKPCAAAAAADAWRPRMPTRRLASTVYSPSSSPFPRAEPASAVATLRRGKSKARAQMHESGSALAADALTSVKHVLLPITDRNPYLSEGTRQAAATTTALAKKYGANITVVVIDDKPKESIPEHDAQLSCIRWHLSEGGFKEFGLMERLGEGKMPTAIIGEVADDLNLDLVVLSMEAIHSKYVDGNLLAEFIPCPVLLLPL